MSKQLNQVGKTVAARPDFEIKEYPCLYIKVEFAAIVDHICSCFNFTASGDGQVITSFDYLEEQVEEAKNDKDFDFGMDEEAKNAMGIIENIIAEIKKQYPEGYSGDVWIYN